MPLLLSERNISPLGLWTAEISSFGEVRKHPHFPHWRKLKVHPCTYPCDHPYWLVHFIIIRSTYPSHSGEAKFQRVPKNFEQFQTCDFPHRLRKLTKNRRLVNFFEEIRFYWQTQFDCLHKYHFYIKSMQDSTKNSKYAKRIYRTV
jgi:hypothetical protein